MKRSDAIAHFDNMNGLAKALKITPSAIHQWGEIVPEGTAYKLQVITGGKLQVDVSLYPRPPLPPRRRRSASDSGAVA